MANGQPPIDTTQVSLAATADPSQVQVLLASNIADDDQLWVVRCSVEELHRLLLYPVQWVASLADLPNWIDAGTGQEAAIPILTPDFGLMVEMTDQQDPDGWVAIQGISGTNCLKVIATKASAVRSALLTQSVAEATAALLGHTVGSALALNDADLLNAAPDPFAPFWNDVALDPVNPPTYKKKLLVEILLPLSRFFAHFEVMNPTETSRQRAARAATFLLASIFDPSGYVSMLNGLDAETLYVKGPEGEKGPAITLSPGRSTIGFYANIDTKTFMTHNDGVTTDPPTDCVALDGPYVPPPVTNPPTPGGGTIDGGMLKRYGIDSNGPGCELERVSVNI